MHTTMCKSSVITARVNPELKHQAEKVLKRLGISMSDTITALLSQIKSTNSIPLHLKIPNEETMRAIRETEEGVGIVECKDINDLFNKLELDHVKIKIQKHFSKGSQTRRKKRQKSS